jgi:hypothetical protein
MTDDPFDRMIRDADPYGPGVLPQMHGDAQHLLEEIMSEPTVAAPPRRPIRRRGALVGAGVAAAVLAGVLVASLLNPGRPESHQASPPAASAIGVAPATSGAPRAYSAMVLKAAEQNPRLLIHEPGWKATTVYGFASDTGTIEFSNGARQLAMNWYPADQYQGYYEDRLHVSKAEPVKVDDRPGALFRYSASDFAVMLRPQDGAFVEMRTGGAWTRTDFNKVLADVVHVDTRAWLAALPAEIVTPDRVDERAAKVLAGVPLPPGFDKAALNDLGTNDPYQFGAGVTSRVGCGWIAEWLRARTAGDNAAVEKAADALSSSHKWKVLNDMNAAGDWPEVFWQIADEVAAGNEPVRYKDALACR